MKIVIEIPEAFAQHYHKDRFMESLVRLKMDVHCIAGNYDVRLKMDVHCIAGNYEKELCDMLCHAFHCAYLYGEEGGN